MKEIDNTNLLLYVLKYSVKPQLFEPGEASFWDDPHISKGMLEAHLNSDHDVASRRPETIDKEIGYLVSSGIFKTGDRALDLGCGPGLYASRLAERGIRVTGIDISRRSLDYARKYAREKGLDIDYRRMNFFDIDYSGEFDVVLQTHGELGTFADKKRDELLTKICRALKQDGLLIFDVTTRAQRVRAGLNNRWYIGNSGFWRPGRHLVLEQRYDYPEDNTWVDQYIVVDNKSVSIYRTWIHYYTPQSIGQVLQKNGFRIINMGSNLNGDPYEEGGDLIAIIAKKSGQIQN